VTDALVVLGYIDASHFLGGDMRLDRESALAACAAVGAALGLDSEEAAWGIREIALAEMTKAVRTRLAMRGLDPREHTLVSFGGCASLFTAEIARALSAPAVIVPAAASVLSALGAATMGMRRERVRSVLKAMPIAAEELAILGQELAGQVDGDLAADGVAPTDRMIALEADLRFVRQNWELPIALDDIAFDTGFEPTLRARFEEEYVRRYGAGSISLGTPIEVVALRAVGTSPGEVEFSRSQCDTSLPSSALKPAQSRLVRSGTEPGARLRVGVIEDEALQPGLRLEGPALIERRDTAIWVPDGATARRDLSGSVILEVS
jgi:N-methylhydantoinase A